MKIHQHRLSAQAWWATLALILVAWFIIQNVALLLELTWVIFGAFILSVMLRPIADWLARRRVPRGFTVFGAYGLLLGAIGVILRLLAPVVGVEAASLRQGLPTMTQQAVGQISSTPLAQWLPSSDSLVQELNRQLGVLFLDALTTVTGLGAVALDLFVILIITYFLVTAPSLGEQQLRWWFNAQQRAHLRTIFFNTYRRLNRWVWTQLGLGIYHGGAFVIGLLLLQVPFALTIGLLGGVLSLIPYLGVLLATLLAALSVLPTDPWLALWVVLFMSAVGVVGAHVVTPVLYGRAVGLNSIVVLIALFVGAQLQGIVGMIFAIPVAVTVDTVLREVAIAQSTAANPAEIINDPPTTPGACHEG